MPCHNAPAGSHSSTALSIYTTIHDHEYSVRKETQHSSMIQ